VTHAQETCIRNLYQQIAPNRIQLYSVQVFCARNFHTQPTNQTTQFWSRASVQVSDIVSCTGLVTICRFTLWSILLNRGITGHRVMDLIFRTLHLTITRSVGAATLRTCQNYEIFSRNTSTASASSTVMNPALTGAYLITLDNTLSLRKQESLANTKVSVQQPWYIGLYTYTYTTTRVSG